MKSVYECGLWAALVLACNHDNPEVRLKRLKILEEAFGKPTKH